MPVPLRSFIRAIGVAAFALDGRREEGDFVIYPQRKLFEAGDYPSHAFKMSDEELAIRAARTITAPLDLEHRPTVIRDDKIGHARNFSVAREAGKMVLRGDVAIHKLLDPLLKPESKMSTTWNRDTRELIKVALLLDPAVPDAALFGTLTEFGTAIGEADFADKHVTKSGAKNLQRLHDQTAEMGAVCDKGNVSTRQVHYASRDEAKLIQQIHDTTAGGGAECEGASGNAYGGYYFTTAPGASGFGEEEASMDTNAGASGGTAAAAPTSPAQAQPSPEFTALQERLKASEAQVAQLAAAGRQSKAEAFADRLIAEERLEPGRRAQVVILGCQTLEDDDARPIEIQLGENAKGSRWDAFCAEQLERKKLGLSGERVSAFSGARLLTDEVGADGTTKTATFGDRVKASARKQVGAAAAANGSGGAK